MAAVIRSRSYLIVAIALTALMLVGFSRTFYLRHWFELPPLTRLLQLHGLVFTAWFALFVVQVRLISKQDYRTHRKFGVAGAVLAGLVVILGLATAVVSASAQRPRGLGLTSPEFVIFPTTAAIFFGALVGAAIYWRRRPEIHRRLMMLAMVSVLGPPTARALGMLGLQAHFLAVQTAVSAAFVIACVIADWVRYRTLHPIFAIGGTLLVLAWPFRAWAATTPAWEAVGAWMASLN